MNLQVSKSNRKLLHLGFAIEFILLGVFLASKSHATTYEEHINRQCSYVVGIPYASDNFSDEEWERFKYCRNMMHQKG